ncbi:MAG: Pectate lyase superfamily protein [Acidobacteria bacterium OLB17]|nr:MAG: Pectate lyase superfamily protein [Acidobacteria bacterium OLB17]MCZ2390731.1 glycoside hydrolase family 55 protein [Acidobacteriota bacterium]
MKHARTIFASRIAFCLIFVAVCVCEVYSQSLGTFDGAAIILDAPLSGGVRAQRYASDPYILVNKNAGDFVVLCDGTQPSNTPSHWLIPRNPTTGYWCFKSNRAFHRVNWTGVSDYLWLPNSNWTGFVNLKDFGAVGDGVVDDTNSIRNAVMYVGAKGGGTVFFPMGVFRVTTAITLPQGILVQGAMGKQLSYYVAGSNSRSVSQILLDAQDTTIFRIGEGIENVRIRNIELSAKSTSATYGVQGIGKGGEAGAQIISFDNVVFSNFDRGIYVTNAGIPGDQKYGEWQFDYVKVDSCAFVDNKNAGLYIDTYNTDWNIRSSVFYLPAVATSGGESDAIFVRRLGSMLIENTFAGGTSYASKGGDFLDVQAFGSIHIINSSSERATNSIVFGNIAGGGDLHSVLTITGSTFGDPIIIKDKLTFVSSGNFYTGSMISFTNADPLRTSAIYSTGDRFCYDADFVTSPCSPDMGNSNLGFQGPGARVIYQSGQVKNGIIPPIPTKIGTDTEITSDSNTEETKPILTLTSTNVSGQGKAFLEMSQAPFAYRISRDRTNGYLKFSGTQGTPWQGYIFDAPVRLPSMPLAAIFNESTAGPGTLIFCLDCFPNTSPCQAGGTGALAVASPTQWSCK